MRLEAIHPRPGDLPRGGRGGRRGRKRGRVQLSGHVPLLPQLNPWVEQREQDVREGIERDDQR